MPSTCQILEPTECNLDYCANLLRNGEVVGVPTETVYGLAGNPLIETSARKIFAVKGRPLIDPLIVHFPAIDAALEHIEAPLHLERLAEHFWPGPMTLVVQKKPSIPNIITAGLESVAIRIPAHPVFKRLLERLEFPLAAPSANPFGYVSPTQAEHVRTTLGEKIPAILDGGDCQHGVESTIIDLRDAERPTILRHGPITPEQIEHCIGTKVLDGTRSSHVGSAQAAPGMLTQHYSPNTSVHLVNNDLELMELPRCDRVAHVYQSKPSAATDHDTYWLSEDGNPEAIAHNLFALIQRLDQMDYRQINIAKAQNSGIGIAINDRLSRAAAKLK